MIRKTGGACSKCSSDLVVGSGRLPYCPTCERAYHALEVRFEETFVEATFDEVVQAMLEDASLTAAGVNEDGLTVVRLPDGAGR